MTRRTNSTLAGVAFLAYIGFGITSLVIGGRARHGRTVAEKLASIAGHVGDLRLVMLLLLLCSFCALVLAVTLYALTREEDADIARLGLVFRVAEGVLGGTAVFDAAKLLWLATANGPAAPSAEGARTLGSHLLYGQMDSAAFFAIGSLCFSWLLLRGRMIPIGLAWLGVIASALWTASIPLQILDRLPGDVAMYATWIPMAGFEVALAVWLIVKGARAPRSQLLRVTVTT